MIVWSFLIPVITCLILFVRFRRETTWWEYLVVFIPSILISLLTEFLFKESKISDYHITSEIISSIRHYDRWNEYIHKTCTREVPRGTDKDGNTIYKTETYDCSYVENHPEYWEMISINGNTEIIEESLYNYYRKLWGTPEKFIDMHRDYHTIDGDAQEYSWCGEKEHVLTLAFSEHYRNYFKLSGNLYTQEEISKPIIDSLNLPEYPKNGYKGRNGFWIYDQNPILGLHASDDVIRYGQWINTTFPDLRVYVVYFKNQTIQSARILEKYWGKGKDNEVCFCIGLDGGNRKTWIYSFSWSPEPLLEGYVKMESRTGSPKEIFDLTKKAHSLGYWRPRDFSEYSYIMVNLSGSDYVWIFWITVIVNILISIWVISNEFRR